VIFLEYLIVLKGAAIGFFVFIIGFAALVLGTTLRAK
jgi:hypothetical protein